jgi:hypothetical protein
VTGHPGGTGKKFLIYAIFCKKMYKIWYKVELFQQFVLKKSPEKAKNTFAEGILAKNEKR